MKRFVPILCLAIFVAAGVAMAHPHFNKTVTAKLPSGAEATIAYNTTPANLSRAESAAAGTFITPRRPSLELSADVNKAPCT